MDKKYRQKYKKINFPEDEQKHDQVIEWWYFNGNLQTDNGHSFSYMQTLFRTKPKEVKIPFLNKVPLKVLYFSHYLLSDNQKKKFYHKINPISLLDSNSFTKPLLWVHYDNSCLIEETKLFNYHLVNSYLDLNLTATKKPLLINKKGFIDLKLKTTYYYSLTRLQTKGLINLNNKWLSVRGNSWMDHQWAQGPFIRGDKWTWFSIQLDNGTDIICFVYGDEIKTWHAAMIDKNNKTSFTAKVVINADSIKYKSKETGAEYQLGYKIEIPKFKAVLDIKPLNKKQEMIFGVLNYWEGGTSVSGILNNKKVSGKGFMELMGTTMKKSVFNIYLKKFNQTVLKNPWKQIFNHH